MVRVESAQEGVHGVVRLAAEGGSLFRFRKRYLEAALVEGSPDLAEFLGMDGGLRLGAGVELPESALESACEAYRAEEKAVALLARAEQNRAGLERKLAAKKIPAPAVRLALDFLEEDGSLSDYRFAASWARQRMRRRLEGPSSLSVALAARSVDRDAARRAIAELCSGDDGREALERAAGQAVLDAGGDRAEARYRLRSLGWKSGDIDEAMESLHGEDIG